MRYLTKSRFKQALECPDKLFYSGRKSEYADSRGTNEFLRELAKGGIQVGELAKSYFPGGIEVETLDSAAAIAQTQELMKADTITIFEAALCFENLLVRVDVLEKKGNTLCLYEVKSKSYWNEDEMFKKKGGGIMAKWEPYVYDIAFQVFVVRKAFPGFEINGSLLLINKNSLCTVDGLFQKFLVRKVEGRYKIAVNPEGVLGDPILGRIDLGNSLDAILDGTETLLGDEHPFGDYVAILATAYANQQRINAPVSNQCKGCEYRTSDEEKSRGLKSGYEECWMAKVHLQREDFLKPHIFDIWSFRKSEELLSQGRYFIGDLNHGDFEATPSASKRLLKPNERQWLQVERVQNPALGSYIDQGGIQSELSKLQYPLHFIDFESTRNAIPYIKGLRPYAQIAFQFSHHALDTDGNMTHGEWIETERGHYPNFDFIRRLKSELDGDQGSIFIYSPFENTVLLDIYDALSSSNQPDRDELLRFIRDISWSDKEGRGHWVGRRKMIDMKDWVMDYYYSSLMKGSNSIKVVLPAIIADSKFVRRRHSDWITHDELGQFINPYELLPPVFDDLDRNTLDLLLEDEEIADGGAAMCAFNLMQFSEMSDSERQKITKALLQYCELDTLAMVMLFEGLTNFGN